MKPIRTPLCTSVEMAPMGTAILPLPSFRVDTPFGHAVCAVFEPTPEERAAIAAGANLQLAVWMDPIPPVSIDVRSGVDYEPLVTPTNETTAMQPDVEARA